ncbi:MAG: LacI family DNA-binding transcriptional regulator [Armatimonadota bacterium]
MPTTLLDIAHAAGVDRSTVCRVLKGEGRVSPETEKRIKDIAKELNYVPNPIARSLKFGKSTFVGVIAEFTVIPVFEKLVQPIEQRLHEKGYSMLFVSSPGTTSGEESTVRQLMRYNVAGLVAVRSSVSPETTVYQDYVDSGGKMVVVNKMIEGLSVPQIVSNDYLPSKLAAEHLISLGHRRIAHLSIDKESFSSRQRDKGFRDALTDAGVEIDESLIIPTEPNHEAAKLNTISLLRMQNPPTAIVTRYDVVAMGACDACTSLGLSVPGDVSITGVSNIWNPAILKVGLTTVAYPFMEMATRGVDLLIKMMNDEYVPRETVVMGAELIVRESTAKPDPNRMR